MMQAKTIDREYAYVLMPQFYQCPICGSYFGKPIGETKIHPFFKCSKCNKSVRMNVNIRRYIGMMKSEEEIRKSLIKALEGQIEAVQTDDEAQYIINQARAGALADVLCMNVYGRDLRVK